MVAVMALMEAPAIIIGVLLIKLYAKEQNVVLSFGSVIKHAVTNGSVFLILGSLAIGFFANEKEAMGIKPFTTDIFKGFLALFLLDMGIISGKKIGDLIKNGKFTLIFSILIPLLNGCIVAYVTQWFLASTGDRFMLAVLAASASYIAVPAAMKIAVPKANPGLFIPMALAITFPINITIGMPIYYLIIN